MKKQDLFFIAVALLLVAPFFIFSSLYQFYEGVNRSHPFIMAFFKFGILATTGEALGLRLRKGVYNEKGFGLMPRAVVWGILGVWIAGAMKMYAGGAPKFLEVLGFDGAVAAMGGAFTPLKFLGAFAISVWMNTTFAPVFMTCHKVTDTHILNHGGSLKALVRPMPFGKILSELNWKVQWDFVFKKTIPFFWIPAHTITFLLPSHWQVLFAALLGVALGVLLSMGALMQRR